MVTTKKSGTRLWTLGKKLQTSGTTMKNSKRDINSYLIDLVSAITDWAVGLLDKASKVQVGYNEYIKVPDIKKLLESIEAMGAKLINSLEDVLGEVLQDRPFVVKEVRRYQEALKILGKKVAVEIKGTIERILKVFADMINRLG